MKYNRKQLTEKLAKLADEAVTIADDGTPITRAEALADLLFKKALGWTETRVDDEGNRKEVRHKPESWAIQLIYERLEGRVAQQQVEEAPRRKAKDRVSDLARKRASRLAEAVVGKDEDDIPPPPPPRNR